VQEEDEDEDHHQNEKIRRERKLLVHTYYHLVKVVEKAHPGRNA
jgi:hypothetical protein